MFEYTEEIRVHGITKGDYVYVGSNAITGTGEGGEITDGDCWTYFDNNRYSTKPTADYTTASPGKLTGNDLTAVFPLKVWPDADTMKSAVLSDSYISTINTHAVHADYYLTPANKLQIKLYFETEAKRNAWLDAIISRPASQFKEAGIIITTP